MTVSSTTPCETYTVKQPTEAMYFLQCLSISYTDIWINVILIYRLKPAIANPGRKTIHFVNFVKKTNIVIK